MCNIYVCIYIVYLYTWAHCVSQVALTSLCFPDCPPASASQALG